MTPTANRLTIEVRVSEMLDRVYLRPKQTVEPHRLLAALREALPGVSLHRSIEGPWLTDLDAGRLGRPLEGLDVQWTLDARRFVDNRDRVRQVHTRVRERVTGIVTGGRKSAEAALKDVSGLTRLDDHQWVNVAAMTVPEGFGLCVFDEQGAGKTVSAIYAFDVLVERDEADMALVLAPKSMVPEWAQDFKRFKGDVYKVSLLTGDKKEKSTAIRSGADVFVTNYETAVSMEEELRALLRQRRGRCVLIVDESFLVKNLDARRTRSVRRLREWCDRAFVLCGTPAPNSPHDLVQQFNIVDFGATFSGRAIPDGRADATPVVQSAVQAKGLYVRHLKADVLPGLPVKRFQRVLLPMQPQQRRVYRAALKNFVSDLRAVDDLTFKKQVASFLSRRSLLLQACSNPAPLVRNYAETPAKMLALDSLLKELVEERREKVVVWSFYSASLQDIVSRYRRYTPVLYDGTVDDIKDRREAVRRFQEDDETMLFVANPAAAGAGITLHRSRIAIFESMSNQAAHYLQSLDRIHRRGQDREVEYIILLCDGTIEVSEYDRLVQKERAAKVLLGDHLDEPWSRSSMLEEAEAASRLLGRGGV